MRTLFLHLGPPKSGSTYLQTALELSRVELADCGIDYPELPTAWAREGQSVFGNYARLFDQLQRARGGERHLLVSGESLHEHLQNLEYVDLLGRLAWEAGFERIAGLLLPRNPVDHASAIYQQRVKHVRETRSVETVFGLYDGPVQSARLVRELHRIRAQVTLRNYSMVRGHLLEVLEEWLGIESGVLVRPTLQVVNRSLTRAELELQRSLNETMKEGAPRIVTRMVEELPTLTPSRTLPGIGVQRAMLARVRPAVDELNALLPPGEALLLETVEPETAEHFEFTAEQLRLLGTVLADEIQGRDPLSRWRGGVTLRWFGLPRRVCRRVRLALVPSSQRPDLHRSAAQLTRQPGWFTDAAEAALVLCMVGPLRRLVPMRLWSPALGRRAIAAATSIPEPARLLGVERAVAVAVRTAASWVPFYVTCLDQAVAGSLMLRRRGLPATVVIGLNRTNPADISHAWLLGESGDVLVGAEGIGAFTPVTEFSRPGRT